MWGLNKVAQQQELGSIPVSPNIKEAFDKYEQDFQAANLPEGKFINPPLSTAKWYKLDQPCFEDRLQELNTDFAKLCISPKPSGAPMGKVPLQVVNEFEHQARQNLCALNFSAALTQVISECNLVMEN